MLAVYYYGLQLAIATDKGVHMTAEQVTEHIYRVLSGDAAIFILRHEEGLALIDAGLPGALEVVEEGLRSLGCGPLDITDVLVTHCHPDHAGGLAEIAQASGARVWMSATDAQMVREGQAYRDYEVTPGEANEAFVEAVVRNSPGTFAPYAVENEVQPGDVIPVAGGILALGAPGHTVGHLAFLWPGDGGVLFPGDALKNTAGLILAPLYEDLAQGIETLRELASRDDYSVVCFAHGDCLSGEEVSTLRQEWG